jgi:guanine deaminase
MDLPGPLVPDALLQTPEQAQTQSASLIARCQNHPLLHYALTPRYALSCSPAMMELCAELLHRHADIYLQTHINENHAEIAAVHAHYQDCRDYLAVYERFGLIGERTVLAHNIHASDAELARIAQADCAICHCPSSNLYLGSGLFPLAAHLKHNIRVGIGSDIGAGTSFSIWRNLADAYSIQQLQGQTVNAAQLLYLATLGGAKMLRLEQQTGNFAAGKSADFLALDLDGDHLNAGQQAYLKQRLSHCESLEQQLFCLLHLAHEQHIGKTFVQGQQCKIKSIS